MSPIWLVCGLGALYVLMGARAWRQPAWKWGAAVACGWLSLMFAYAARIVAGELLPGPVPPPPSDYHLIGFVGATAAVVVGAVAKRRASERKWLLWCLGLLPVAAVSVGWTETRGLPLPYHAAEALALVWWVGALRLLRQELREPGLRAELDELQRDEARYRRRHPHRRAPLPMQRQRAHRPRNQRAEANTPPPRQP